MTPLAQVQKIRRDLEAMIDLAENRATKQLVTQSLLDTIALEIALEKKKEKAS